MMKYMIAAVAALFATSAFAADLPSRKSVTVTETVVPQNYSFYLGVNGGYDWVNRSIAKNGGTAGAVVGFQYNPYLGVEGTYDHSFQTAKLAPNVKVGTGFDTVAGNVLLSYPVGQFTPYALAGVGYRWTPVKSEAVYNVGGGVKYAITERIELDGRYRYIADFTNTRSDNVLTAGINIKF